VILVARDGVEPRRRFQCSPRGPYVARAPMIMAGATGLEPELFV